MKDRTRHSRTEVLFERLGSSQRTPRPQEGGRTHPGMGSQAAAPDDRPAELPSDLERRCRTFVFVFMMENLELNVLKQRSLCFEHLPIATDRPRSKSRTR